MSDKQYTSIGALKKPHGLNGEMKVYIPEHYLEDFFQAKAVFLKTDGTMLPYFVNEVRGGAFIILNLEEIDSREKALRMASKEIYLRTKDLIPESEKEIISDELEYGAYVGYNIQDAEAGVIGSIERVEEYPQQEMAIVIYNEKEIMIPLNDHFITKIDNDAKVVLVDLPEGLLNL